MIDLDAITYFPHSLLISFLTLNILCILCRAKENKQSEISYQNILKDSKNKQNIKSLKQNLLVSSPKLLLYNLTL